MNPVSLPALIVFLFILLLPLSLVAQTPQDDDGVLGFAPRLSVSAETRPFTPIGSSSMQPGIVLHQHEYIARSPLLPTIFFDEPGSFDLPSRYRQFRFASQTAEYSDQDPCAGSATVAKYREILNIVGYRMRKDSTATIELEGGYSAEPGETPEVANERASVVREYLTSIWNIKPERIAILPARQSCDASAPLPAQEEGRCVRMRSDTKGILAPIRVRSISHQLDGLRLHVDLDPMTEAFNVTSIDIDVLFDDSLVSSSTIPGHPDSARYRLIGNWAVPGKFFSRPEMLFGDLYQLPPLEVRARVRTIDGSEHTSNQVFIPVKSVRYGATVNNSCYIPFFDYRQETLNEVQRTWLDYILHTNRSKTSDYRIIPSSDATENFDVEKLLAERQWRLKEHEEVTSNIIAVHFTEPVSGTTSLGSLRQSMEKDPSDDSLAQKRANRIVDYMQGLLTEYADRHSTVETGTLVSHGIFDYSDTPEERLYERRIDVYLYDSGKVPKPTRNEGGGF